MQENWTQIKKLLKEFRIETNREIIEAELVIIGIPNDPLYVSPARVLIEQTEETFNWFPLIVPLLPNRVADRPQ